MNRRQFVESLIAAASLPVERLGAGASWALRAKQPTAARPEPTLWYPRAASRWVEALPVGNGRLGAMVFGDIGRERLQINDDTLWSGGPANWDSPAAREALAEIRRLTLAGNLTDADKLSRRLMGAYTQSYLPLGDVHLTFEHGNLGRDYRRQLHLADAVASVRYRVGEVRYTREVLASHPAGVIAMQLTADRPGLITFDARVSSPLRHAVTSEHDLLRLRGVAPAHVDPSYYETDVPVRYGRDDGMPGGHWTAGETPQPLQGRRTLPGMRFELALGITADGGTVAWTGERVRVANATAVTIVIATATGFNGFDKDPAREGRDPGPIVVRQIEQALARRRGRGCATRTSPIIVRSSIACRSRCLRVRPRICRPISASSTSRRVPTPGWSSSCFSTAAICSSPAAVPARSRPISRASGTTKSGHRGARTTRSTSTPR